MGSGATVGSAEAIRLFDAMRDSVVPVPQEAEARVTRVDEDGMPWVAVAGSDEETPANGSVISEARVGQLVRVSVQGGRLSIVGNATSPSVGGTYVHETVAPVSRLATEAMNEAQRAHDAAEVAEGEASRAHAAADSAQESADAASTAAESAQSAANVANTAAADAAMAASDAADLASTALDAANAASDSASDAKSSADAALASAIDASDRATDALGQLSVVQDVVGTVQWAAEHSTYELTEDTEPNPEKTYYARTGDGTEASPYEWTPVAEPSESSIGSYYERSISEAMQSYITSHLALTDAGLWVTLDDDGYKLLLASDGVRVYDPAGSVVSTFGENIEFDADRPQRIGSDDAYVAWVDTDDDNVADSLLISGASITIGTGQPLSELIEQLRERDDQLDGAITAVDEAKDELAQSVEDYNAALSQRIGEAESSIESNAETLSGSIDSLSERVDDEVNSLQGGIDSTNENVDSLKTRMESYFDFAVDGLTIGRDGSSFTILIDNQQITFRQKDDLGEQQELAYASGSAFHAPTMAVDDELQLDDWSWVPRSNRNLALKWTGDTTGGE